MIIYMARNKINGKSYIGQTVGNLRDRKQGHIYNVLHRRDNAYFHNAIRKYGIENFDWKIIHDDITTIEDLNKLEIYYIGKFDTFEDGYNLTLGGDGSIGFKHSEETKKKLSLTISGENNPFYGKHHSEETKKKISKVHKGKTMSEESIKKMVRTRIKNGTHKGKNNAAARAVIINDKHFDTIIEAAKAMGVFRTTIRRRILHKTEWLSYNYAEKRTND